MNISAALKITLLFLFIFSQLKTEEKEKLLADVKTRLKNFDSESEFLIIGDVVNKTLEEI